MKARTAAMLDPPLHTLIDEASRKVLPSSGCQLRDIRIRVLEEVCSSNTTVVSLQTCGEGRECTYTRCSTRCSTVNTVELEILNTSTDIAICYLYISVL